MNRVQKESFVSELTTHVGSAQALAVMSFEKLSVDQMTSFRLSLRKQNVRVKVVKNTLARKVFGETTYKDLSTQFRGPTLVAFGSGDPVLTAKAIAEWADKENFGVKVKSGAALGQVMSEIQMKALAKLPGRNELLVSFLWALKSEPTKFLYALQDPIRRLGYALQALKENKN